MNWSAIPIYDHWAPEFRPSSKNASKSASAASAVPMEYEGLAQRKDGSKFSVQVNVAAVALPDGPAWLAFIMDITARKRAEQALRESEEKFSKAFQASPNGMSISEVETGRFPWRSMMVIARFTGISAQKCSNRPPSNCRSGRTSPASGTRFVEELKERDSPQLRGAHPHARG